jgi:hypothetical protein
MGVLVGPEDSTKGVEMRAVVRLLTDPGARAIKYIVGIVFMIGGVVQGGPAWWLVLAGFVLSTAAARDICLIAPLLGQSFKPDRSPPASCQVEPSQVARPDWYARGDLDF